MSRTILCLCLLIGSASCRQDPAPEQAAAPQTADPAPPTPPAHAVLRPLILTRQGQVDAGAAFVIRSEDGSQLLLSALHLLGPAGGLARQVGGDEVTEMVQALVARAVDDDSVRLGTREPLTIAGARAMTPDALDADLLAFAVDPDAVVGDVGVLELAEASPEAGARVWLLAQVPGRPGLLHAARVSRRSAKELEYEFDDRNLDLRATSGAPILGADGRVVAVHLGGGALGSMVYGLANPVESVRARLLDATGKNVR